jgi:uncharacterized protein
MMNAIPTASPLPQVRDFRFQVGPAVPRHWHGGRRSITLFFNNLSVFFPAGERFFIASVKAHEACVEDPALKRELRAFCAQEGIHSREHARYNRMLEEQGYPTARMERRVQAILKLTLRSAPLRRQLAITCALEHFTAMMGHILLSEPRLLEGAHPEMAALWRWHAMEETEHKAVAFDVYRAAGGGYFTRVVAMLTSTLMFWSQIVLGQVELMHAERCLSSPREWLALLKFLFVEPGGMVELWRRWLDYFRPSFHPWDLDNRELLERHLRELALPRGNQ